MPKLNGAQCTGEQCLPRIKKIPGFFRNFKNQEVKKGQFVSKLKLIHLIQSLSRLPISIVRRPNSYEVKQVSMLGTTPQAAQWFSAAWRYKGLQGTESITATRGPKDTFGGGAIGKGKRRLIYVSYIYNYIYKYNCIWINLYIWCSVAHPPPPLWMGHGPPPPPVVVGLWWGSACFWCCWLSLVSSASPPPCGCVDGSWWWWRCWKYVYKYLCVYEYIYMYMYMMKWICTYNHMYIYVYIYTYVIMFMNMYVYGYVSSPPLWCG